MLRIVLMVPLILASSSIVIKLLYKLGWVSYMCEFLDFVLEGPTVFSIMVVVARVFAMLGYVQSKSRMRCGG